MTFAGADRADVAAAQKAFGTVEEIDHQSIAIPGSLDTLDLRAEDPNGKYGHPTLRLVAGRFPTGAGDIAMTAGAAATFDVHIGDRFVANGVDPPRRRARREPAGPQRRVRARRAGPGRPARAGDDPVRRHRQAGRRLPPDGQHDRASGPARR